MSFAFFISVTFCVFTLYLLELFNYDVNEFSVMWFFKSWLKIFFLAARKVTFHRQVLTSPPDWSNSEKDLRGVDVFTGGFIENATSLLQVRLSYTCTNWIDWRFIVGDLINLNFLNKFNLILVEILFIL